MWLLDLKNTHLKNSRDLLSVMVSFDCQLDIILSHLERESQWEIVSIILVYRNSVGDYLDSINRGGNLSTVGGIIP